MKRKTMWKKLTRDQERNIVKEFNAGMVRNKIMRRYNIPEGQLYHIIRETGIR